MMMMICCLFSAPHYVSGSGATPGSTGVHSKFNFINSAAACSQESLYYRQLMSVLSVCVCVIKLFSDRYSSYSFSLILTKVGTHDLRASMQKNWNRFSKFWFFEIFGKCYISAAGLQPVELIVSVFEVWMSSCWCVAKLFSNRYFSYSFPLLLTKLGTHDLCASMQKKTMEEIFQVLILQF